MQHFITLLLGQIALTQPGGVVGHCPVGKQMIVPLSPNQMGWRITVECCGSIPQRYTFPSGLGLVGLSFVFQQGNDPTHLQAV